MSAVSKNVRAISVRTGDAAAQAATARSAAASAKVKICGLMRKQDIDYVNKLIPDYAGFVFAPSRRRVSPGEAKRMASDLGPAIQRVGVFADATREFVLEAAVECSLDIIQLHGGETSEYWHGFPKPVWKVVQVKSREDLAQARFLKGIDALLLDSAAGGSGKSFDWNLARECDFPYPLVLAGGLNPENVVRAIRLFKPFAVDVSSGVETNGVKDYLKIKRFIENVRRLSDE